MISFLKKKLFTIAAIVVAALFWFFDASIHYFIYGEPEFEYVPSDINELWMRLVIVGLLLLFGLFADYFTNRIMLKEKQMEVVYVYNAMLHANHHILNNVINQMKLFKMEAMRSKDFDREVINLYDNTIREATELIDTLSKVKDVSDKGVLEPLEAEKAD
ncbi:MAG: hypothetical protein JSW45_03120 [Thiotrichales bacterium]|nr:MAG: hypothetical protein JSW45_03120 [Thiotrichales bacterium]